MSARPLVSVIIPVHNRQRFIAAAVDSALAQTYPSLEVVIVDDGSDDDTPAVCQDLARRHGQRLRWARQANAGPSAARNHAARLARGDLLAFLDSDDLWLPEKMAKQVPLFEDAAVGLAYAGVRGQTPDGALTPPAPRRYCRGRCFFEILGQNPVPTSATVIRSELFAALGGFDEGRWRAEDKHLWLRAARRANFAAVAEDLVLRRLLPEGLSVNEAAMMLGELSCLDDIQRLFPPQNAWEARRYRQARLWVRRHYGLNMFNQADYAGARAQLWRAQVLAGGDLGSLPQFLVSLLPAGLADRLRAALRRARRPGRAG